MTGELNLDYELSMHFIKGLKRVDINECFTDVKCDIEAKLVDLASNFVEKSCASDCYRPLPPMLGNGESIDLHKLYGVVKQKGGFDSISKNGLWDEVGLLYGLGPGLGSSIKLIYVKYLKSLESWLVKLHKDSGNLALREEALMELENDYNGFVSKFSDEMKKNDKYFVVKMNKSDNSFVDLCNDDDNGEKIKRKKIDLNFAEIVDLCEDDDDGNLNFKRKKIGRSMAKDVELTEENKDDVKLNNDKWGLERVASKVSFMYDNFLTQSDSRRSSVVEDVLVDNVSKSSEISDASMKYLTEVEGKFISVDSSVLREEVSICDTNHDSLLRMVQWMTNVAKDPTDPEIGVIPESSKWAKFENHNEWKQVLLAREAIFMKRNHGSITDVWQKKQRMHPSMFEDHLEATERLRSSSRLLFVNVPKSYSSSPRASHYIDMNQGRPRQRLGSRIDLQPRGSIYTSRPQQRIPVGPHFQAQVPDWIGVPSKSDPKWLGTRVWPLETGKRSVSTERGSIGKGRIDGCDCASSSSPECVKLHVASRSRTLEVELGSAFYVWNFHKMGERYSISWTSDEELKFKNVVKENPLSLQKFFWLEMSKILPRKTWTDLVNYYFNVFVLRRRGSQNRLARRDIDSDDDETEYRFTANYLGCRVPKSLFLNSSSKKGHLNIK